MASKVILAFRTLLAVIFHQFIFYIRFISLFDKFEPQSRYHYIANMFGFFKRRKASHASTNTAAANHSKDNASLPTYASLEHAHEFSRNNTILTIMPGISCDDAPQWRWNNDECKTWLYLFFRFQLGMAKGEAHNKACEFQGCGATLYIRSYERWENILGSDRASGLFGILVASKNDPGAVPRGMVIYHYQEME